MSLRTPRASARTSGAEGPKRQPELLGHGVELIIEDAFVRAVSCIKWLGSESGLLAGWLCLCVLLTSSYVNVEL